MNPRYPCGHIVFSARLARLWRGWTGEFPYKAEEVGVEPTREVIPYSISSAALSASQPLFRFVRDTGGPLAPLSSRATLRGSTTQAPLLILSCIFFSCISLLLLGVFRLLIYGNFLFLLDVGLSWRPAPFLSLAFQRGRQPVLRLLV